MGFDIDRATAFLARDNPAQRWPTGAPAADYLRSPAAARIGALAEREGLFLFHFERRAHRPIPADFLAEGLDPELAEPPQWHEGTLPEAKYHSFRHDLMIGSFHPGHRGKWTTHELCHALVGFGYRPGAPPLFHATAARLAELLPVVLYYFLDEVRLRRCPDHAGGGPLWRSFCPACEEAAALGPVAPSPADREHLADAARFLDRELAAVARTRRLGRPIGHRFGSLDLCTDGLAYAAAHRLRLESEAFERYAGAFAGEGGGCWSTLDALEERVLATCRALVEGSELARLAPSREVGRWRWIAQDLGWRMIEATVDSPSAACDRVIDALASAPPSEAAIAAAVAAWPGDPLVLELGYPIPGAEPGRASIAEGLRTVVPICLDLFEDAGVDPIAPFLAADPDARTPLGDRFARWIEARHGGPIAALCRFEVALRHASSDPLVRILGEGLGSAVGRGVRILDERWDPIALADRAEAGDWMGVWIDDRLALRDPDGNPPEEEPTLLEVARDGAGEVAVVEADPDDPVEPATRIELGLWTFERWPVD